MKSMSQAKKWRLLFIQVPNREWPQMRNGETKMANRPYLVDFVQE